MIKKLISFLLFVLLLTGCGRPAPYVTVSINASETAIESNINSEATKVDPVVKPDDDKKIVIPATINLAVPFVSQAPLRNWDPPYNEACEEASMLSVVKYFNKTATDSQTINEELLALFSWETDNSYEIDINAAEVTKILNEHFGLKAKLVTEVTIDRIKYELSLGRPIIIPASGRTLGNPYFRTPGPIYHMLVIRGYDSKNFITNDVGTNTKGVNFKYTYQTIIDSIHDWDQSLAAGGMTDEEMARGRKVMIVVEE